MPTKVGNLVVFGAIEAKWLSLGGLGGALGAPVNNETPTFDGVGRYQDFQAGRTISWHPDTGAHLVYGSIGARWREIGRERFGYPINDESGCPDGVGRFNHFRAEQLQGKPEASIYWSPASGAHEVYGAIRDKWARLGWERGSSRYPLEAEHDEPGVGRLQRFQGGYFTWTPAGGAQQHNGAYAPPPRITLRAISDGGRFIEVQGDNFTGRQSAKVAYDLFAGGGPTMHQTGEHTVAVNEVGHIADRIRVNLSGLSGAQVQATDLSSGRAASASL
ncbi:LGFP repeat-containing protein [Roseomonas mucosa]